MNVLFLRPQPAIRSLKYALGFRSVNVEIRLYHGYASKTLTELYGYGDKHFDKARALYLITTLSTLFIPNIYSIIAS